MTTEPIRQLEAAAVAAPKSKAIWQVRYGLPLVLVLLTFLAYGRSLTYDFVYDDRHQIVGQTYTQSWHYAPRYFTENIWEYLYPGEPGNYYRPVFMLWLLIQYSLFGLQPFWWHLVAIATQAAVAILVFIMARRLTGDEVTAAIAGLIFALHPIHIEVAAWVSGVTESLMALFFISALLCFMNWREAASNVAQSTADAPVDGGGATSRRRPVAWLAASLILFALALFEKETAIMLPLLILIYEWLFGERRFTLSARQRLWPIARAVIPYALVAGLYLAARMAALQGFAPVTSPVTFATMLLTLPSVIWFYIKSLCFPVNLSPCYDTPYLSSLSVANFWLPLLGIAGVVLGGCYWLWTSHEPPRRRLGFAMLWLLATLSPVLYLRALFDNDMAHDRYLYLPSIGFAVLLAMAIRQLPAGRLRLFQQPAAQVAATLALALALGLATALQHAPWENDLTLWTHAIHVAPNSPVVHDNLAGVFVLRDLPEPAIREYQRVLELDPDHWEAHFRLGFIYGKLGNQDDAERFLRRAIEINPKRPMPYVYLAFPRLDKGRLDEAEALLHQALNANDRAQNAHYGLGLIHKKRGNLQTALAEFNAELAIHPTLPGLKEQIASLEAVLQQAAFVNSKP